MVGSSVTAFAVDTSSGANGATLGTTTSAADGSFNLSVARQSSPVRLTVSGGSFASEMNGATIGAPGAVSALLAGAAADASGISINPLSSFVDSRTVGILSGGTTTFGAALSAATTQIEQIYGLATDPAALIPSYTTSSGDAASLGVILGAIINEDQYLCPASPGGLVTALASDISDGVFDGRNAGGPIGFCAINLPAIAGTAEFQSALSGVAQLQLVTQAFAFGGAGNLLTTNGLANIATGGTTAYPLPPLATINNAITRAAPAPINTFAAPSGTAAMNVARYDGASVLLPGGVFLIAGGAGNGAILDTIELYSPATNTFAAAASIPMMNSLRANETATLLPNGKVLIAGGAVVDLVTWTATTDIYDPAAGTIDSGPSMSFQREGATAVLLPNSLVLIAGGRDSTQTIAEADLYDPASNLIAAGPSMTVARYDCAAALLPNGQVLIAGGYANITQSTPISSTEIYNVASNTFTVGPTMSDARAAAHATLLPNGKVLIAGGTDAANVVNSTELYDPSSGSFSPGPNMSNPRKNHTQVLLANGKVLIADGYVDNTGKFTSASTDLYDPATNLITPGPAMNNSRGLASAALLPNGEVIVAGGVGTSIGIQNTTDLYTP